MYSRNYGGLIWTNHALDRLTARGLSQERAWETFKNPDIEQKTKDEGTLFQKRFGETLVTVIAKQNEKKEWIVISVWMDPPLPGSEESWEKQRYRKYRKASFMGKLFLTLRKQLGI